MCAERNLRGLTKRKDNALGRPLTPSRRLGTPFPVVDLFAGPGGLGEGFSSALDQHDCYLFRSAVAIERDPNSHLTLTVRHFFRFFPDGQAPQDYYDFLAGRISQTELFSRHPLAYQHARQSAIRVSLEPGVHNDVRRVIKDRLAGAKHWVLIGGPPCQAYSLVGRSRMNGDPNFAKDERHLLYLEYLRIIADHRPPMFVMENVKGLLSANIEGKSAINRIIRDLQQPSVAIPEAPTDLGYRLYSLTENEMPAVCGDPRLFVVRAEDHGIPQARHRMFIVGVRSDLNVRPAILKRMIAPTVRETISSLPAIRSGLSKEADSREDWVSAIQQICDIDIGHELNGAEYAKQVARGLQLDKLKELQSPRFTSSSRYSMRRPNHDTLRSLYDDRLTVLTSHEARSHMASDLRRYVFAATFAQKTGRSPKLADFPISLLPKHRNVDEGSSGKMFSDRFRVQIADQVSTTITSHISKDGHYFIHYDPAQCRSLTVREAARLQTFPDNYYFAGPRTEQYHQVGNAVPPKLAQQIALVVAEVLASLGRDE